MASFESVNLLSLNAKGKKAEAKATEFVSQAIAKGEVASINYFIADKYLRALTEIVGSPNQKVLMFPIEMTSVLGTLGGIAEIVNATFGGTPSSTSERARRPTVPALTRIPDESALAPRDRIRSPRPVDF